MLTLTLCCRNHEEEQEADGTIFKSVQARWPVSSRRN